jgi:HSF-type DNA-binding
MRREYDYSCDIKESLNFGLSSTKSSAVLRSQTHFILNTAQFRVWLSGLGSASLRYRFLFAIILVVGSLFLGPILQTFDWTHAMVIVNEFSRQLEFFPELFESFIERDFLEVISLDADEVEDLTELPVDVGTGKCGIIQKNDNICLITSHFLGKHEASQTMLNFRHCENQSCGDAFFESSQPLSRSSTSRSISPGSIATKDPNENCLCVDTVMSYTDRADIPASVVSSQESMREAIANLKSGSYDNLTALNPNPNNRNKSLMQFPVRLYAMLERMDRDGYQHVISWQPHGRCFLVHDPKKFQELLPKYLPGINQLTSFRRQVSAHKTSSSGGPSI